MQNVTTWSTRPLAEKSEPGSPITGGNGGGFDPYRAWLNVRDIHRPLNAYQLLGLAVLDEDLDNIRAAAGAQRVAIQAHRYEGSPEVWQQVNDELEDAIAILLDPDRKVAYDANLKSQAETERVPVGSAGGITGRVQIGTIRCSQCGFVSPATKKFCANCGKNLWEPCFNCGTLSMSGEKYCGACGVSLTGIVQQKVEECERALEEADRLAERNCFDEAIAVLEKVTAMQHNRLEEQIRRASERIKRFSTERTKLLDQATEAMETARRFAEANQYEDSLASLELVPDALRTDAMRTLYDEMKSQAAEVVALEREVQEALSANRAAELLPKVDRLLALKPDHPHARTLAGKLRTRLCQLAKEKVLQCQYEAAMKFLDQVPAPARTPELEALRKQAAELAYLAWDLRTAPFVDRPLVVAAERLARLMPKDPKAAKIKDELQKRSKMPRDLKRPTAPWAKLSEPPFMGFPAEWLNTFERLTTRDDLDTTMLMEHPGCFFVACGLALQGLGKAPMKTNLVPSEKSIVGRVSQLRWFLPVQGAWGLDLSSSGLKAIKLILDEKAKTVRIEGCDFIEHRKLLSQAVNEEEERILVEESIRTFVGRNETKGTRVCLGLPSRMVFLRQLKLPAMEDATKLNAAVQYEARRLVPIPLDDLAWGFERLEAQENEADVLKEQAIVLLAAKRLVLKDRLTRLEAAGLKVDVVQSDCVALYNYLAYDYFGSDDPSKPVDTGAVTLVVDLGSDTSNIIIASPRAAWFYPSGFGAHSLTKALVREFQLTAAQAEQIKKDPSPTDSFSQFHSVAELIYDDLAKEIKTAVVAYAKIFRHKQIGKLLGVGGMFQNHGLLRYLRLGR